MPAEMSPACAKEAFAKLGVPAFLLAKADPQLLQAIWGAVFNDSPSDDAADPATQPKTPEEFAEVRKLRGSCRKFAEGGQGGVARHARRRLPGRAEARARPSPDGGAVPRPGSAGIAQQHLRREPQPTRCGRPLGLPLFHTKDTQRMTTIAIAEAPAPPQTSGPFWTLGAATERPGVGMPGQIHITQQGAAIAAAVRFKRGPGPTAEPPDPVPALTEAVRRTTAESLNVAAIKAVNGKRAVLQAAIAGYDAKTAELAKRRDDPALIESPDLGKELHELDLATDAVAVKRAEARRQLDQLDAQLKRAGLPLQIETRRGHGGGAEAHRRAGQALRRVAAPARRRRVTAIGGDVHCAAGVPPARPGRHLRGAHAGARRVGCGPGGARAARAGRVGRASHPSSRRGAATHGHGVHGPRVTR